MSITRRLQFSMAALVVLGTVLLAMGQSSTIMPLLAIFAACTSLAFTDVLGWFRLHRVVANLAAIAAAVFTLWNFFREPSQQQLLSIANLLSILLMILLYQEKNERLYWQICVLSLLQVVVAAALNLGLLFGILLVVYMLVAIVTLMLFYLHREAARMVNIAGTRGSLPWNGSQGDVPLQPRFPLGAILYLISPWLWFAAVASLFARAFVHWFQGKSLVPAVPCRASIDSTPPTAYQPLSWGELEDSLRRQRVFGLITTIGAMSLLLALILFYSLPRLSHSAWQGPASGATRVSGFTPHVSFDEMGEILQSRELVMRVEFYTEETREPYTVDNPYFRGAVLVDYEYDGESSQWAPAFPPGMRGPRRPRPTVQSSELVREVVHFATSGLSGDVGGDQPLLFSTVPIYPLVDTPGDLRFDSRAGQLYRSPYNVRSPRSEDEATPTNQYRYALGTTAFRNGWTASITPHQGPPMDDGLRNRLLRFDRMRHTRLREVASLVLDREELRGASRQIKAQALASHFLDPRAVSPGGEPRPYTYSLRPPDANRNVGLDAVEDFVAHHRQGHCEYFASALALMLRSQGIPARLALGYKGGEYNSVGRYWQVRQSQAHAWVEVYLEPDEIPPDALALGESAADGGWLLLDPTPPDLQEGLIPRAEGWFGGAFDLFDYAQFLWQDYVVGLNSDSQRRSIYPPVDTDAPGSFADLFSFEKWGAFFSNASRRAGIDPRVWLRGEWFSWRAGLVAMVSCLGAVGLFRLGGFLLSRYQFKKRHRREISKTHEGPQVAFYRRFAEILGRLGVERRPEQTQREFASTATAHLIALPVSGNMASIPRRIVEAFYRVRFGGATLDRTEAEEIEQNLESLERSLA